MEFNTYEIDTLPATFTGQSQAFKMCFGWNWSIETEATGVNGNVKYTILVRNSDNSNWAELNLDSTKIPYTDKVDGFGNRFVWKQVAIQQFGSGTTGTIKYTFTISR
jgi:hypothetical protein